MMIVKAYLVDLGDGQVGLLQRLLSHGDALRHLGDALQRAVAAQSGMIGQRGGVVALVLAERVAHQADDLKAQTAMEEWKVSHHHELGIVR
jgi:hypothetical protein